MGIFQSIEEANNTSERLLRSEIKNSHGEFENSILIQKNTKLTLKGS